MILSANLSVAACWCRKGNRGNKEDGSQEPLSHVLHPLDFVMARTTLSEPVESARRRQRALQGPVSNPVQLNTSQ